MANCILAWPNYADPQPTPTIATGQGMGSVALAVPTFAAYGSWRAALPLANLQTPRLYQIARSTDATTASSKFCLDFGVQRPISLVALVRHNLSQAAQVRIRLSNDSNIFAPGDADSGWINVYQPYYAPGSLPFGWNPGVWMGGPTAEDLQGWTSPAFYWMHTAILAVRYVYVEVSDPTNTAGYVQLARAFAGPAYQPELNMNWGAQLGFRDQTAYEESLAGVRFYDERPKGRVVTLTLDGIREDTAMEMVLEMQRSLGKSRQLFFAWDPSDTYHRLRRSMLATLDDLDPLTAAYFNGVTAPVKLAEVL